MNRRFVSILCIVSAAAMGRSQEAEVLADEAIVIRQCPIVPKEEVKVPVEVAGIIAEFFVVDGQKVVVDQPLLQIDDTLAKRKYQLKQKVAENQAPIQKEKVRLEEAEAKRDATKILYDRNSASLEELREAEASVALAAAMLADAEAQAGIAAIEFDAAADEVKLHHVKSPINGEVDKILPKANEAVKAFDPVLLIVNTDEVKVKGMIDAGSSEHVKLGMIVDVYPDVPEPQWKILAGHTAPVNAVAILPGGTRAISGSADGQLIEWDLGRRVQLRSFKEHADAIHDIAVDKRADAHRVVTVGADDAICIWDMESGSVVRRITTESTGGAILCVALDPSNPDRCITGHQDRRIRVWNIKTGDLETTLSGHNSHIGSLAVSPDGKTLMSADDQTVRLWDLKSGKQKELISGRSPEVHHVGMSRDGRHFLFNSHGNLQVRDVETAGITTSFFDPKGRFDQVAAFSPVEGLVVVGGGNQLQLWQAGEPDAEPRLVRRFQGHLDAVRDVDFSDDGALLVTGSADRTVRLFRVPSLETIQSEKVPGVVTYISPQVEFSTQTRGIYVEAKNVGGVLDPGRMATIVIDPNKAVASGQ